MALKDLYTQYNQLYGQTPADMADPEAFYTPELQEAVLQNLAQAATERRDQNQADISGAAIRSGFGVGGSSREMARRARADSMALDEIIQGSVQQAAAIEDMRRMQMEEAQSRRFQAEEGRKDQQQAFDLAKQGYQANIESTQRGINDQDRADRQDAFLGGLGGLVGGAADLFAQMQKPQAPTSYNQQNPVWYDPSKYRP